MQPKEVLLKLADHVEGVAPTFSLIMRSLFRTSDAPEIGREEAMMIRAAADRRSLAELRSELSVAMSLINIISMVASIVSMEIERRDNIIKNRRRS